MKKIKTPRIRGTRLIAIASRRKIKFYGNKVVITHVLKALEPIQTDLEDFIAEASA